MCRITGAAGSGKETMVFTRMEVDTTDFNVDDASDSVTTCDCAMDM